MAALAEDEGQQAVLHVHGVGLVRLPLRCPAALRRVDAEVDLHRPVVWDAGVVGEVADVRELRRHGVGGCAQRERGCKAEEGNERSARVTQDGVHGIPREGATGQGLAGVVGVGGAGKPAVA